MNVIAPGTTGLVLTSNGSAADPTWEPGGGTGGDVNVIQLGGNAVATGNGTTTAGTQRFTLSSDSSGGISSITGSVTPGTGSTNLGKAEDGTHTSSDTGVMMLGVRADSSTATTGANGRYSQISTNSAGNVKLQVEPSLKASYMACSGYFTPANSATDMFTFYGSSTKTIKILRVELDYIASSAPGGVNNFSLNKNSSAPGGSSNTVTGIPLDSNNSAASASALYWTSLPTTAAIKIGTLTVLTTPPAWAGDASRVPPNSKHILFDHALAGQAITLNGTAEGISLNNGGTTVSGTGKQISVTVYWTEE